MQKKLNPLFSLTKNHLSIIVKTIETQNKFVQLNYYIFLRDYFNDRIDKILLKNNKEEIFKFLENIDKCRCVEIE